MNNLLKGSTKKRVVIEKTQLPFSSVSISYKTKTGLWRGFVLPYDVTYESTSQQKVMEVLKEMVEVYEEGLELYGHPDHLKNVLISSQEDMEKWNEISQEVTRNLLANNPVIKTAHYYAEAKLPA